jgi:hypothetical protein
LEFHNFFPYSLSPLRLTGYEQDTFGADDVGEVDSGISLGSFVAQSFCDDEARGSLDPSSSGCAGYKAHMTVEPGLTPTAAVLSLQTRDFLSQLLVGKPSLAHLNPVIDTELYAGQVTAKIAPLRSHRRAESEPWQDAFKPGALARDITGSADSDGYVKSMRQRVLKVLGPKPTPKYREKVKADLLKVKPSIPAALYQKYLCDLETGQACPAPK